MIEAYCVDPITYKKWLSVDTYGDATFEEIAVKGYVEYKTKVVVDIKGEDQVSLAKIWFPTSLEVKIGRIPKTSDRMKLDGEDYDHAIINFAGPKAFSHPHYEIFIQ